MVADLEAGPALVPVGRLRVSSASWRRRRCALRYWAAVNRITVDRKIHGFNDRWGLGDGRDSTSIPSADGLTQQALGQRPPRRARSQAALRPSGAVCRAGSAALAPLRKRQYGTLQLAGLKGLGEPRRVRMAR